MPFKWIPSSKDLADEFWFDSEEEFLGNQNLPSSYGNEEEFSSPELLMEWSQADLCFHKHVVGRVLDLTQVEVLKKQNRLN